MKTISEQEGLEKYGKEMADGDEIYKSLSGSEKILFWDYKTLGKVNFDSPKSDFLNFLDKLLAPHGLEVVKIKFDGDAYPWTIERKDNV